MCLKHIGILCKFDLLLGYEDVSPKSQNIISKQLTFLVSKDFPGGSGGEESTCSAGDLGSVLGSGRSPGEENGNPLLYSCLENPMDRGAWQAAVHGSTKSQT